MEERGVVQEIWEHFDFKYMQPIFLKELIPHREFQIIRDQNQSTIIEQNDEENKE